MQGKHNSGSYVINDYMTSPDKNIEYEKIKTPSDLVNFMDNIMYGFVGKNGKKYTQQDKEWGQDWYSQCVVQPGEDLLRTRCGTCWDQVELERDWFEKHNYEFKTIFIWFGIPEPSNYPTHTFLAFKDNNKWFWFEHSFAAYRGIFEFNSLKELIEHVKLKQLEYAIESGVAKKEDIKMLKSYEYTKPKANLGVDEYIKHVTKNAI